MSFFAIFRIPALVNWSIFPLINTKSMFFAIYKASLVDLSIFVLHYSFSCSQIIIRKIAFVLPVLSFILSTPMLFTRNIFSFVNWQITWLYPSLFAFSIRQISLPSAFISIAYLFKRKHSSSLCLLLKKLAFVIPSLWTYKSALSTWDSFYKWPDIATAIWI